MESNFEHQQWLCLGMHAPCGHDKKSDLWLKKTTQKNFEQKFENKGNYFKIMYKGWPQATELQQYLYLYEKLDFHLYFSKVC